MIVKKVKKIRSYKVNKKILMEFAKFLLTPLSERDKIFGFKTIEDFSKKYGLNDRTLRRYKKSDEFKNILDGLLRDLMTDNIGDVFDAMLKGIKEKTNPRLITIWFKIYENLIRRDSLKEFFEEDLKG